MFILYLLSALISLCTSTTWTDSSDNASHHNTIFSSEQVAHLEKQVTQWGTNHLAPMQPQELQIIANMVYLFYVNTLLDLSTRTYVPTLLLCTQKIEKKLQTCEDSRQELALVKALTDKLQSISRTRNVIINTMQEANNYMETNAQNQKFQPVISAIQALQLYGQQLLSLYANNYKQEMNECMTTNAKTLDNIVQLLHSAADMYKKPDELDNLLPDVVTKNKELVKIELASNIAHEIRARGWESIAVSQDIMNSLTQLVKVAQTMYSAYYQEVYAYMKRKNNNAQSHTHMFNAKGLLPAEYRTNSLPTPQELEQQFTAMQSISLK